MRRSEKRLGGRYRRQQKELVSLLFFLSLSSLSQRTHCCCLFTAVKSGHPVLDSISGLLARPNPLACLTTVICPTWLVRLAFRLSIRAALKLVPQQTRGQQTPVCVCVCVSGLPDVDAWGSLQPLGSCLQKRDITGKKKREKKRVFKRVT